MYSAKFYCISCSEEKQKKTKTCKVLYLKMMYSMYFMLPIDLYFKRVDAG